MSEGKRNVRVGRLDTVGGVCVEMGKVYRQARRGDLETEKAARLIHMLHLLRGALETSTFEARFDAIEAEMAAQR